MFFYYSANIFLCWMALGVLSLLVYENDRIRHGDKRLLYLTYALIAASALAEYLGVALDGSERFSRSALMFVKCVDYILTPMAGGALVLQMRLRNRWNIVMMGLLAFNTLLQVFSGAMGGWMVTIDAQNHYAHGPLYPVYIGLCLAIVLIVVLQFMIYGRSYRRQNRASLYATLVLVFAGIAIQELSDARTSYTALAFGAALLFIHYTEFVSQKMDDHLRTQQLQLDTDVLTGVYSRRACSQALRDYDAAGPLPVGFAAFTVDINGLKEVNDSLGHEAGDELIRGAAECIGRSFDAGACCYRTGGDEFVVLTTVDREEAANTLRRLEQETRRWHGNTVNSLRVAAGYALAADHEGQSAEMLVKESDKAMYEAKAAYYHNSGKERRRRR